ncbi:hypothetical protein ACERII_25055 [Evansella sp. AB-rgal1]|uniref:hypothetical protein n=1 Tax=Evansella sp. AB-rgal1 TaxID=3242696 RepID=UPI00359D22A4
MKRILSFVLFIILFSVIIGCSSDSGESTSYQQEDFNISLLNTAGETINISPAGKTLYAYFTGVG